MNIPTLATIVADKIVSECTPYMIKCISNIVDNESALLLRKRWLRKRFVKDLPNCIRAYLSVVLIQRYTRRHIIETANMSYDTSFQGGIMRI